MAVVLFHYRLLGVGSGFVGVDVFFVISGFLMMRILQQSMIENTGREVLKRFWLGRARRIAPALIVLSVVTLLSFSPILLSSEMRHLIDSALATLLFISNLLFNAQSGYFDAAADTKPLLHTWSLSVEWQFYIFFPLLMLAIRGTSRNVQRNLLIVVMCASYAYCIALTKSNASAAYFLLPARAWEFLAGGLIVFIQKPMSDRHNGMAIAGFAGVLLIFGTCFCLDEKTFPGWVALVPVTAAAMVIACGQSGWSASVLSLPLLQFLGHISYSLYLWHWPVLVWLKRVYGSSAELSLSGKLFGLCISLCLSVLSFYCIEKRYRRKTAHVRLAPLWWISILLVGGAFTYRKYDGDLSFRLPPYVVRAEAAIEDGNPRRPECFLEQEELVRHGDQPTFCSIGQGNALPSVLLWGDSFADAVQPMVEQSLLETQLSGVVSTASGCAPMDISGYSEDSTARFSRCAEAGKHTWEFIQRQASLNFVVLSANWRRYQTSLLLERMPDIACDLKQMQKTPIFIGVVHKPSYDVPRAWAMQQLREYEPVEEMMVSQKSNDKDAAQFERVIQAVEARCGPVLIVNPLDQLCADEMCFNVRQGKSYFVDDAHLSAQGAAMLGPAFKQLLSRAR